MKHLSLLSPSLLTAAALMLSTDVYGINKSYAKKLEESGCTQVSELQGCDINKTKEENAKAGFVLADQSQTQQAVKVCAAKYGAPESCEKAGMYRYPDFDLIYLGQSENGFYPGSTTRRLAPVHTYQAVKDGSSKEIRWSMGTGDISPASFEIGGKSFIMEIAGSEILDCKLNCKGIVVWPKEEFEQALSKKYSAK